MISPTDNTQHADGRSVLSWRNWTVEVGVLIALFFAYAGDPPPMVNEAHYLVKAKNFWQPEWCAADMFVASAKAHRCFYWTFGWLTLFFSLPTSAWIGRFVGWFLLAAGLQRLSWTLIPTRFACVGVAILWIAGIEWGNLAGEWVVGGIEAKIPAYGFTLFALAEIAGRRWRRVWPLLGAASAFHVLVGGWSVVAAMVVWWMTERPRTDAQPLVRPSLLVGGAIALLGLVPALALTANTTAEDSAAAARMYTYVRIAHHLLPSALSPAWYIRHAVLIAATAATFSYLRRHHPWESGTRIGWYTATAVALAGCGLLIGMLPAIAPDLAAKLLRYYWFRLTDFAVPLFFGLVVTRVLLIPTAGRLPRIAAGATLALAVAGTAWSSVDRMRLAVPPSVSNRLLGWHTGASPAVQQSVYRDWLEVCQWVRAATPADEVFLTPRHQQTFKWYAHRAEVVNWKDVPQDAEALTRWSKRFAEVFPRRLGTVRVSIQYRTLRELRDRYGVRYMVVDRRVAGPHLPLVRVYPRGDDENKTYAVYRLP